MRILINDHAGHPFQVQLSRSLGKRGHTVLHTYSARLSTPRGSLQVKDDDPAGFDIQGVKTTKEFLRYSLVSRYFQEKELGRGIVEKIEMFKPDAVISANTPLGAQARVANSCRKSNVSFIFWVQDLLGVGIRNNVKKKVPLIGPIIGWYYCRFEQRLLKKSDAVVIITDDFYPVMHGAGVADKNVHVIENWAPLEEMPVRKKKNPWSRQCGLDKKFCFLYSGTLGMKHNPDLILRLALRFKNDEDVAIVVISEGIGADFLKNKKEALDLTNLFLFPFQPFEALPDILGAGDVLLANLEPDAGVFAVPSKVLTYLCTQRPILVAVPPENLASRIVKENNAGLTVHPLDHHGFVNAADELYHDRGFRKTLAENGRRYAEQAFDIEKITDRFESIILSKP